MRQVGNKPEKRSREGKGRVRFCASFSFSPCRRGQSMLCLRQKEKKITMDSKSPLSLHSYPLPLRYQMHRCVHFVQALCCAHTAMTYRKKIKEIVKTKPAQMAVLNRWYFFFSLCHFPIQIREESCKNTANPLSHSLSPSSLPPSLFLILPHPRCPLFKVMHFCRRQRHVLR